MKYCIEYKSDFDYLNTVDEIIYEYNNLQTFSKYEEIISQHINQHIIFSIVNETEFLAKGRLIELVKYRQDHLDCSISLRFDKYNKELCEQCKEYNIPFFLKLYANNWETLHFLKTIGVCSIYVVEDLCFNIKAVADMLHQNNITIRTYPHINQVQYPTTDSIKGFFIRPEDEKFYQDYIDIYEFFGDGTQMSVYFKVYKYEKEWYGDLREIITGLNTEIDSRSITPKFAEFRTKCKRICLQNGTCNLCDRIVDLSRALKENNLKIIEENEKEENENG